MFNIKYLKCLTLKIKAKKGQLIDLIVLAIFVVRLQDLD